MNIESESKSFFLEAVKWQNWVNILKLREQDEIIVLLLVIQLTIFISYFTFLCKTLPDWTVFSSVHNDPMASDVIAPSPWTIFGCKNGKHKKNLLSLHHWILRWIRLAFRIAFVYWGKGWWFRGEGNSCMKQRLHILLMTILAR